MFAGFEELGDYTPTESAMMTGAPGAVKLAGGQFKTMRWRRSRRCVGNVGSWAEVLSQGSNGVVSLAPTKHASRKCQCSFTWAVGMIIT